MFITISISAQLLENGWDIDSWKGVLCGGGITKAYSINKSKLEGLHVVSVFQFY